MERQLPISTNGNRTQPHSESQSRVPGSRAQRAMPGLSWRKEGRRAGTRACRPGLPSSTRRDSGPARPRGGGGAHSPPRAPEQERGKHLGPDPPPGDLAAAAPSPARGPNGPGRQRRGPGRPRTLRKRPERRFPRRAGERRGVSAAGGAGRAAEASRVWKGMGEGRIARLPGRGQSRNSPSSARRALPLAARGR